MDLDAASLIPSTSVKTKMTKKEFRERCKAMQHEKEKGTMLHEMLCTPDGALKKIQKGSLSMGHVDYALFVRGFREAIIKNSKQN
jgi:hypothetical protein